MSAAVRTMVTERLELRVRGWVFELWSSAQALRSAYIGFLRTPRLPELVLGAQHRRGLRLVLARSGLGRQWVDRYAAAMAAPGALAAALAWYRAATPSDTGAPRVAVLPEQHPERLTHLLLAHLQRARVRPGHLGGRDR